MSGYSADVEFLNLAAEQFTGESATARLASGRIQLAVMLDPHHPQISPADTPGVLHLLFSSPIPPPFRLQHSKVALLAFHDPTGCWLLRVILATGNWTMQTRRESVDLVWSVDLCSADPEKDAQVKHARADVHAAASLMVWLRSHYAEGVLVVAEQEANLTTSETRSWVTWTDTNIAGVRKPQQTRSRFFDNRQRSTLAEVLVRVPNKGTTRNFLAVGSGFYEATHVPGTIPTVLDRLERALRDDGSLTATASKYVYVNPSACQSIRSASADLDQRAWYVKAPVTDATGASGQALHAKFVFSANDYGRDNCPSAWLYLGSGNLTTPGFLKVMSSGGGNLEAGVVLDATPLKWTAPRKNSTSTVPSVDRLLPIERSSAGVLLEVEDLSPGPSFDRPTALVLAPPVSWLEWRIAPDAVGYLHCPASTDTVTDMDVMDERGKVIPRTSTARPWRWDGPQPRQVTLRWGGHEAAIPVVDSEGRIAAGERSPLGLDAALELLFSFPHAGGVDDDESGDDADLDTWAGASPSGPAHVDATSPIRRMMRRIEHIAKFQCALHETEWFSWCRRLRQTLVLESGDPDVKEFNRLKVNPLSPLYHPPFRPAFAAVPGSECAACYEGALDAVAAAWGVARLPQLGGGRG